ncbi:MAG TPA: hypothetical protein VIS71_02065 [Terrimicrobium sp.]
MKFRFAMLALVTCLLVTGCTIGPPPQRGYDAEVNVEQAGVRLLRNGMTVCLIRPQFPNVEKWELINGNTEIVIKSRGDRGPASVERFDTKTGILKDRITAVEIQEGRPDWAEGFGE